MLCLSMFCLDSFSFKITALKLWKCLAQQRMGSNQAHTLREFPSLDFTAWTCVPGNWRKSATSLAVCWEALAIFWGDNQTAEIKGRMKEGTKKEEGREKERREGEGRRKGWTFIWRRERRRRGIRENCPRAKFQEDSPKVFILFFSCSLLKPWYLS